MKHLRQRVSNEERKSLKRQQSSPYLRVNSLEKIKNSTRNSSSLLKENLWRKPIRERKESNVGLKNGERIGNQSTKKRNSKQENKSNPFLKKKKLVYNYIF